MKALAIDSATTKLTVSAKNDDKIVTASYDIGMKQSETLLPAIQYVLEKADLTPSELNYTAISEGPGSFTGLRLGFSALKAFQTANKTPIYGISTLKVYAHPFFDLGKTIVSVIDAKKDRFYAAGYKCGNDNQTIGNEKHGKADSLSTSSGKVTDFFNEGDYELEEIAEFLKDENDVFVAGFDSEIFIEAIKPLAPQIKFAYIKNPPAPTDSLFDLAEEKIRNSEPPLKDFDGPIYLRASEAEIKAGL